MHRFTKVKRIHKELLQGPNRSVALGRPLLTEYLIWRALVDYEANKTTSMTAETYARSIMPAVEEHLALEERHLELGPIITSLLISLIVEIVERIIKNMLDDWKK